MNRLTGWMLMGVLVTGLIPGCSKEDEGTTVRSVEGTIRAIEADKNRLKLQFRTDDSKEPDEEWGFVTPQTEIKINGQISDILDIKVGDRAQVMVQVNRDGGENRYTAQKITIQRDEEIRAPQPPAGSSGGGR